MERIRIDTGIREIEVNDSGDSIKIPVNDTAFYKRFVESFNRFEKKRVEIDRKSKELSGKYPQKETGDGQEEKAEGDPEINMEMFGDAIGYIQRHAAKHAWRLIIYLAMDAAVRYSQGERARN